VWIERLSIEGFRGLSGEFEFAEGLTIVVGDNEAGKSSLHESLVRMLFGFSKTERRKSKGISTLERRIPWDGSPYRLHGTVHDQERTYRIEWDFQGHSVRLLDELGNNVSDDVLRKGDEVALGEFLVGMEIDDFRQVCCIDQEALLAVRHSPSLGVALQEAVANVAGDTPVEDAIDRLNEFLRHPIGVRVDNLRPSQTGRLNALGRERDELRATLHAVEEAREELVSTSRDRALAREKHDALLVEYETLRQREFLTTVRELELRIADARRLGEAAAEQPKPDPSLGEKAIDAVKGARQRLSDLDRQVEEARREVDSTRELVETLEEKQRTLVAGVDGLAPYGNVDTTARDGVHSAWGQLESLETAASDTPTEIPPRDPLLAEYRAERNPLIQLTQSSRQSTVKRVLWIALVVVTVGIAWAIREIMRRRRVAPAGSLEERLAHYGAASLDELDRRATEEDREVTEAEAVAAAFRSQLANAEERRKTTVRRIEDLLDQAKAPPGPLQERVRAYLHAVEQHEMHRETSADLERVRRQLVEARRPEEQLDRLVREREQAERRLRDAHAAVGVNETALTEADAAFDSLLVAKQRADAEGRAAGEAAAALEAVLAGETLDEIEARADAARRTHEDHCAKHGILANDPGDSTELRARLAELEITIRHQLHELTELETRATQLEEQVGDPAELKERVERVDSQINRLNEAKDGVALARTVLDEAAQALRREFAPHLNEALKRNLGKITGGRYEEAMVNSDLAVQVVVPEDGRLHSADDLSRATKDQLFLVQRLEIARLLAPTKGVAPLLLDDPFSHYDHHRLRYGLEVVAEASRDRQIVLFSEDPDLADIAKTFCGECHVIELKAPAATHDRASAPVGGGATR
jgi:DNA repair protein SbcC/Rad50